MQEVHVLRTINPPDVQALITALGKNWSCNKESSGIRCENRQATEIEITTEKKNDNRTFTIRTHLKDGGYSPYNPAPMVEHIQTSNKQAKYISVVTGLDGTAMSVEPKKDAILCAYLGTTGGFKGFLSLYSQKGHC